MKWSADDHLKRHPEELKQRLPGMSIFSISASMSRRREEDCYSSRGEEESVIGRLSGQLNGILTGQSFYVCTSSRSSRTAGFLSPMKDIDARRLNFPLPSSLFLLEGQDRKCFCLRLLVCLFLCTSRFFIFILHASSVAYSVAIEMSLFFSGCFLLLIILLCVFFFF